MDLGMILGPSRMQFDPATGFRLELADGHGERAERVDAFARESADQG